MFKFGLKLASLFLLYFRNCFWYFVLASFNLKIVKFTVLHYASPFSEKVRWFFPGWRRSFRLPLLWAFVSSQAFFFFSDRHVDSVVGIQRRGGGRWMSVISKINVEIRIKQQQLFCISGILFRYFVLTSFNLKIVTFIVLRCASPFSEEVRCCFFPVEHVASD